jgi:hypothetical protein
MLILKLLKLSNQKKVPMLNKLQLKELMPKIKKKIEKIKKIKIRKKKLKKLNLYGQKIVFLYLNIKSNNNKKIKILTLLIKQLLKEKMILN